MIAKEHKRPADIALIAMIKVSHQENAVSVPIGYIHCAGSEEKARVMMAYGWALADGTRFECSAYPELYAVIGDDYCPPTINCQVAPTRWQRFFLWLGLRPTIRTATVANLDYVPGMFRVPDARWGIRLPKGSDT